MGAKFGPAGNSESFHSMGYRKTIQVPEYIDKMGLDAYEYQCGRGVRITPQAAKEFGELAAKKQIGLSLHAPYYISLSGIDEEKRLKSIDYILQSACAASNMGAERVVVHSGSCAKITREEALSIAKRTLKQACDALAQAGYSQIRLCPETMGKINQLGTLEEVLDLCTIDERLIPCIDFGHLNARTFGGLCSFEAVREVFETIENKLGIDRLKEFHSHFSKIEYTFNGGEKAHLTFEDTKFGPDFEPVAEMTLRKNCSPVFICESAGTQAEDAQYMKHLYQTIAER